MRLQYFISNTHGSIMSMIVHVKDIANIRSQYKQEKIVLTSGTFDLLHVGHLRYLSAVKSFGDVVVVMLSSDERVKARKGSKRPIILENDRAQMLDALKIVDYVFIDPIKSASDHDNSTYAEIVTNLQLDMYATDGPDPRFWNIMDHSKLTIIPRSEVESHASTSAIISHIVRLGINVDSP